MFPVCRRVSGAPCECSRYGETYRREQGKDEDGLQEWRVRFESRWRVMAIYTGPARCRGRLSTAFRFGTIRVAWVNRFKMSIWNVASCSSTMGATVWKIVWLTPVHRYPRQRFDTKLWPYLKCTKYIGQSRTRKGRCLGLAAYRNGEGGQLASCGPQSGGTWDLDGPSKPVLQNNSQKNLRKNHKV